MSKSNDKELEKAKKKLEKANAKRLLLETNLERVFNILAGYSAKRHLGETLEQLHSRLKHLKSQVDSERGIHFGHVGPVQTRDEMIADIDSITARQNRTKKELAHLQKNVISINKDDIVMMFNKLGFEGHHDRPGYNMEMEIDRMIFECDESMNNSLTFDEIKTCYYRSINDDTGLEPFQLFNLIQFLMYDEDLGGSCSIAEVSIMMVTRYGEKGSMEHIAEMKEQDDGDGELSYSEYLHTVEKRPSLDFLRAKGEGLSASKCIHIDWQSEKGRVEAKKRSKERGKSKSELKERKRQGLGRR
tara:strand:- start:48 stop:953 length:906 start_codon:yes stop_codon:yes gene_type:complete